jgi:lupus La protein
VQKGFGEGEEANTQEKIEQYFDQFGLKVNQVRLRRKDDPKGPEGNKRGAFKGSVFVEFAYKADLDKFIAMESYPKFQTGDSAEDMLVMTK